MRHALPVIAALAITHCLAGTVVAQPEPAYHPNHVLVCFRPGFVSLPAGEIAATVNTASIVPSDLLARLEAVGATSLGMATPTATPENLTATDPNGLTIELDRRQLDLYVIDLADTNVIAATEALRADSDHVAAADPDWLRHTMLVPDDPLFFKQWWLRNNGQFGGVIGRDLHAAAAWDQSTGVSSPVDVVVIDSGSDPSHPDLAGRVINGPNYITTGPPYDDASNSHGTSVSGIIAATGNNGIGVAGVHWGARIVAVKACCDATGGFPSSAINAGVDWARVNGYKLVNMSFGGANTSAAEQIVLKNAYLSGMAMFAAMGNNNDAVVNYPAAYSPVTIGVGAFMNDGLRWNDYAIEWQDEFGQAGPPDVTHDGVPDYFGSAIGPHIQFLAPGGRFIETTRTVATGSYWALDPYSGVVGFGGTSAATPAATGVASLLQSVAPVLTGEDLTQVMSLTAEDVKTPAPYLLGFDPYSGYGRLQADEALAFVSGQNQIEQGFTASVADVAQQSGMTRSIIDWPGIPSENYPVIRHTLRATFPFSTAFLTSPAVWARRASSYGAGNENPVNGNLWVPNAWIASTSREQVTLEAYVYDLRDIVTSGHRYWWPTSPSGVRLAFTAIGPVSQAAVGDGASAPVIAFSAAPNPVVTGASVTLSVPVSGLVSISIFDVSGRLIRQLASGALAAGAHRYRWDLSDQRGEAVATGLYFARAVTPAGTKTVRLVVAR